MKIQYLIIFLMIGIFIGEGQAMSPVRGGAPKRVGGGGVASPGAALVSPGLPCKDIKDERDTINCFSNGVLYVLPSYLADKKITKDEYDWLKENIKSLLEEIRIAGKLKDNKYIYEFIKNRANKAGIFTDKSSISPKVGMVLLTYVLSRLGDAIKDPLYRDRLDDAFDNTIWNTELNPDEEKMADKARIHALEEKLFNLKVELVMRDAIDRDRIDRFRPGRDSGGYDGARPPVVDRPPRDPGYDMTKSTKVKKYSGW